MKTFIIMCIAAISFTACNNDNNSAKQSDAKTMDSTTTQTQTATNPETKPTASANAILPAYLQIKNGLANDNGKEAAAGGTAFMEAIGKMDKSSMTDAQKKVYEDMADDAKEMAEHISTNAGKIEHQREHFDMLSNDVYDLVKAFGAGQPLYKDFCPMYNNKKGAIWLSEMKEIKNPYLGKKMRDCGSVKEELK
jgi:hypothetical protein